MCLLAVARKSCRSRGSLSSVIGYLGNKKNLLILALKDGIDTWMFIRKLKPPLNSALVLKWV